MPNLDATANTLNKYPDIDKTLQNVKEDSINLTEEAIAQAAQEITQEVKAVVDDGDISTSRVKRSFRKWIFDQLDRVGQTAIALIAATIVALLTPLLVKLELIDEWQKLSNEYSSVLTASVGNNEILEKTVTISQTAEQLENQNTALIEALSAIEIGIDGLKSSDTIASNKSNIEALRSDIKVMLEAQSLKLDNLRNRLAETTKPASIVTRKVPVGKISSPVFVRKLESYISKGKSLRTKPSDLSNANLDAWIGEVYFFVSMMPSKDSELNTVKSHLYKIYSAQKPFSDPNYRLNQAIMVLNAVHSWAKIPG
ncbi:hypothetical protein [Agarilytica rhodophyticola]|uniref:hypothetical protein n=1 Tax=Agarilytica rhodophyticola TaxID=1737490 RepID=UPI000B341C92|nr:hypothetical protein [Agarilytica rhodophyticola]